MQDYCNKTTLDNPYELLTHVDEQDNILGSITRKDCHNQKITPWHRTTHIYIINSKEELLLTERSTLKDTAPGQIVISSGGHVQYGEEPLEAARRELLEELGLKTKLKFIKKYKINYKFEKEFVYVYFGIDDNQPVINKKEVNNVQFIPLEKFKNDYLQKNILFPPGAKDVCDLLLKDSLLVLENFKN